MVKNRFVVPSGILLAVLCFHPAAATETSSAAAPSERSARSDQLPERLKPKQVRSERDQDKVTAAALYTHGRLLFQRQQFDRALRRYQRAWRYDPQMTSVLQQIVALAFSLERHEEAARYAVIAAEQDPSDVELVRQLGRYLAQQEQLPRGLRLYESALAQLQDQPSEILVQLRLEMGKMYVLANRFDEAADSFAVVRQALDHPERFGLSPAKRKQLLGPEELTWALMGESFLRAKRWQEALEMFRRADRAQPDAPQLALRTARLQFDQGKMQQARNSLQTYLDAKRSSADVEPYLLLDRILGKQIDDQQQRDQRICTLLKPRYDEDPGNAALGYFLADRLRKVGQLDDAEPIYRQLLKVAPARDAYAGLMDICRQRGQLQPLLEVAGQYILANGSLRGLGDTLEALVAAPELAGKLRDVLQHQQDRPPGAAFATALLALKARQFDVADDCFELAVQTDQPPQAQVFSSWGLELVLADQPARAARVFRRAIELGVQPENNHDFYFYLAGALEGDGHTDEAIRAAKKAIALKPDLPRLHARLAWILFHAKRTQQAEKEYRKLIERFDADYKAEDVRDVLRVARLVLSALAVQQERQDEAVQWLEEVLDEFPEDISAKNDLGYLWADQGQHLQRALAMVQEAVASQPENAAYRDSLGWAYYRLGRYQEAVEQLQQAAEGDQPDGVILDHLGDALWKLNRTDEALQTWQRAADQFQKEDDQKMLKNTEDKIRQHAARP